MNIATPKVTLIAHTALAREGFLPFYNAGEYMDLNIGESTMPEDVIEFAGRACYRSFGKPNPKTRETRDYLARTLFDQGHWSIAEHATVTLYFEGVSRAFTHELIRHRHLSYSQESQRFVDSGEANVVLPPALRDLWENTAEQAIKEATEIAGPPPADLDLDQSIADAKEEALDDVIGTTFEGYRTLTATLMDNGKPRKQAREAARAFLPNMTETRIVVTGNLRAWHEVIARRTAPDADAEMQEVMSMAQAELAKVAPSIFGKEDKSDD